MPDTKQDTDQLLQQFQELQAQPTCSECGTYEPWGLSSWCPQCGFYPKLGKCVGQTDMQGQSLEQQPQPQNIWELIPAWGWVLGVGTVAAIGLSVGGRFYCEDPGQLCLWTITQATVGLMMFLVGHFIAYLNAVSRSADFSILSIIVTPFKIWRPAIRRFPQGAWKLDLAVWGLTLVVGAFAIVGGFEFNSLFKDWGVKKTANVNLLSSVVDQSKSADGEGGADNIEDALNDFAGGTEEEDSAASAAKAKAAAVAQAAMPAPEEEPKPEPEPVAEPETAPRLESDCLLVGYSALPNGTIDAVLLASSYNKQLVYAGYIRGSELPEDIRLEWQKRLPQLEQKQPFVKTSQVATWIKPRITLKVSSEGWTDTTHRLIKPQFVSVLQEISLD
ncbi:hypothetical protein [Gimesia maris]|uniref:DNA ligase (ATP) n=1 Tax=Gimesia maris TaxID=122 RepID=A0ABX5YZZ6_9PLAN|nr:hypothetical protein [Gimesia maris]EDL60938.1 hypothetical protein PM8797T_09469 [Gimesia maris DSM 8797]QEG20128.1 hypothetical protein GmarT_60370 [Gimesia maris]QGQ32402.1 hypothetical protein F1729_29235 [Gimesia maris]